MSKEDLTPFTTDDDRAKEAGRKGGLNKKGSKHISTFIQQALTDPNFELKLKDGTILREMPIKAIIKTAVAKSVSGDTRAMEWLAKHGYGIKNIVELDTTDKERNAIAEWANTIRNNADNTADDTQTD
jgi:hypothetical protein